MKLRQLISFFLLITIILGCRSHEPNLLIGKWKKVSKEYWGIGDHFIRFDENFTGDEFYGHPERDYTGFSYEVTKDSLFVKLTDGTGIFSDLTFPGPDKTKIKRMRYKVTEEKDRHFTKFILSLYGYGELIGVYERKDMNK